MFRTLGILAVLMPSLALAQANTMDLGAHATHQATQASTAQPREAGQGAFAAIQEIVALLEADPKTDWSKVDIDSLRLHLIDMDNVTLKAKVTSEAVESGLRFTAKGEGAVRDSIRRMVLAHAATMSGAGGWKFLATEIDDGATLTVYAPAQETAKLRGLGFIGVMTRGMHHQEHHLMIARGQHPH